jgi:hypothetical protein
MTIELAPLAASVILGIVHVIKVARSGGGRPQLHPLDLADDEEVGDRGDQGVGADEHQRAVERAG